MKKEYGLVLAGGGTKGAYEVGAWKALKEMNMNITAICGASIGAINAALMIQDDFDKLLKIYDTIKIENIVDVKEKLKNKKNILSAKNVVPLATEYVKTKGFDNKPLREMMEKYLDIDKIYSSNIELGMTTYSKKSKTALEVFKEDIPKDEFIDYLLATACFPIYKGQKIGEEEYFDGGYYDNVPINMLAKKGYKNIIVIDISNDGIKRKIASKGTYLKIIRSNEDLGGIFEFDREKMKKNMMMGYLDTLKAFNKLQGHTYYFTIPEFNKLVSIFNLNTLYGLEYAARIYNIDKYQIYTAEEFLNLIMEKHNRYQNEYNKFRKVFNFKRIVSQYKLVMRVISKGFGLCFFMDMLASEPKFRTNKLLNKFFSDYIVATDAMNELINYKE
ncbi:MAG: patatin-like phospholipase family protein [Clostridia bacterium]|nr:patatin-like phospholipase family protein [Clostridia bacterium]